LKRLVLKVEFSEYTAYAFGEFFVFKGEFRQIEHVHCVKIDLRTKHSSV